MFLLLFPVFTLSTNFPIIAITLRNNLKGLFLRETRRYSFFVSHCLFPLLAIIPPTVVGLVTSNVEFLVGVTGAYAGSIIQVIRVNRSKINFNFFFKFTGNQYIYISKQLQGFFLLGYLYIIN